MADRLFLMGGKGTLGVGCIATLLRVVLRRRCLRVLEVKGVYGVWKLVLCRSHTKWEANTRSHHLRSRHDVQVGGFNMM